MSRPIRILCSIRATPSSPSKPTRASPALAKAARKDTLKQCAGRLIGHDPQYIEKLWQDMPRSFFYPPGREKTHALGALDLALWDIKGKVHEAARPRTAGRHGAQLLRVLQHGRTIPGVKPGMSLKERAQLTIEAGYRAFRMGAADAPANTTFNTHERINKLYEDCAQVREGVGKNGDWCVDFHQRFDLSDAMRGCDLIKDLAPFFVEDPVRAEAFNEDLPILAAHRRRCQSRRAKSGAIAGTSTSSSSPRHRLRPGHAAERRRHHRDDEDRGHVRDALRRHRAAFHRPIATAALVNSLGTFSGPVLMEYNFQGKTFHHLPVCLDFKNGKLFPTSGPDWVSSSI